MPSIFDQFEKSAVTTAPTPVGAVKNVFDLIAPPERLEAPAGLVAPKKRSVFDFTEAPYRETLETKPPEAPTFKSVLEDPSKNLLQTAWGLANVPLLDHEDAARWMGELGGYEPGGITRGVAGVVSGLSTPLSLLLLFGGPAGRAVGIFEPGGAAILAKTANMSATEIAAVTKGARIMAASSKAGRSAAEGLAAVRASGIDPVLVEKGTKALLNAGLNESSLLSMGFARRAGSSLLRDALGVEAATAEKVGAWTQLAIDAGFGVEGFYHAVTSSPRFFEDFKVYADAKKRGDEATAAKVLEEMKELGVIIGASTGFGILGIRQGLHDAGAEMDSAKAFLGLHVKPSEEVTALRKIYGKYDVKKVEEGRAQELWSHDIRKWGEEFQKKYPGIDVAKVRQAFKNPDDQMWIYNYIEAGGDLDLMRQRQEWLTRAIERPDSGQAIAESGTLMARTESPVRFPDFKDVETKYGTTDNVRMAGLIGPDGRMIPLGARTHFEMIGEKPGVDIDPRIDYINQTGVVRSRMRTGRAGTEMVFTVPESGVSPEQALRIQEAARSLPNGRIVLETASRRPKSVTIDFPKAQEISDQLERLSEPETLMARVPRPEDLTTAERRQLVQRPRVDDTATFVRVMGELPSVEELKAVAQAGEVGRHWYDRSMLAFKSMQALAPKYFHSADAEKFAGVVAATSPQQAVPLNLREALQFWKEWADAGRPETEQQILAAQRAGKISRLANQPSKMKNLALAIQGKDLLPEDKTKYFKVGNFAKNLAGNFQHAVQDSWMGVLFGRKESEVAMAPVYHAMALQTRLVAEELGWRPAEAQASMWVFTKTLADLSGWQAAGGKYIKPPEALKFLTPDNMAATASDFADIMRTDRDVRYYLTRLGVDLNALDKHLDAIPGKTYKGITEDISPESLRRAAERIGESQRQLEGFAEYTDTAAVSDAFEFPGAADVSFDPAALEARIPARSYGRLRKPEVWAPQAAQIIKTTGGVTWNPRTGRVREGYVGEVYPEGRQVLDHPVTAADIQAFYKRHEALFAQHPELSVGAFGDQLEISAPASSLEAGRRVFGRLDQQSLIDARRTRNDAPPPDEAFVSLGGQGKNTAFPDYPLAERLRDLSPETENLMARSKKTPEMVGGAGWYTKTGKWIPVGFGGHARAAIGEKLATKNIVGGWGTRDEAVANGAIRVEAVRGYPVDIYLHNLKKQGKQVLDFLDSYVPTEERTTFSIRAQDLEGGVIRGSASFRDIQSLKDWIHKVLRSEDSPAWVEVPELPENLMARTPGFYSKAEQVAQSKLPDSGSGDQFLSTLRNNGVKADELKWTGLDDFLTERKRVSKTEVEDFLRENAVQVEEIVRGGERTPTANFEYREGSKGRHYILKDGVPFEQYRSQEVALKRLEGLEKADRPPETKFEQYQTPGGTNYRELLLTLPEMNDAQFKAAYKAKTGVDVSDLPPEQLARLRRAGAVREATGTFSSAHWDEPNVLAHVRLNDRVDASGKRTLFIEEVQSDWHQKGRREGYKTGKETAPPQQNFVEWSKDRGISKQQAERFWELERRGTGGETDFQEAKNLFEQWRQDQDAAMQAVLRESRAVPDAPFKSTWHELAMKRVLRYAAEHGYDKVAWTTGEQQAARYDLSKVVDQINWDPKERALVAFKGSDEVINRELSVGENLESFIGKEAAKKLEAVPADSQGIHTLEGVDLRVGGEGMKGFYDRMLPEFLNKYGKKWGAKVGETEIRSYEADFRKFAEEQTGTPFERISSLELDELGREFDQSADATKVHSIDITEPMKKSVMEEGQPLFARKPDVPDFNDQPQEWVDQIADTVEFSYEPRKGAVPSAVKVNESGREVLKNATRTVGWVGIKLSPNEVPKVELALKLLGWHTESYNKAAGAKILGLKDAIAQALKEHPEGGVAIEGPRAPKFHELIHVVQTEIGGGRVLEHTDLMKLSKHPAMETMTPNLVRSGYDANRPQTLAIEAAAHLMAGEFHAVGISAPEAADFLTSYFRSIVKTHKLDSLDKFNGVVVDSVNDTILKAVKKQLQVEERIHGELERLDTEGLPATRQEFEAAGGSMVGGPDALARRTEQVRRESSAGVAGRADTTRRIKPETFLESSGVDEEVLTAANRKKIAAYRKDIKAGKTLEPVELVMDKDGQIVGHDGVLRAIAMREEGQKAMSVRVHRLGDTNQEISYLASRETQPPLDTAKAEGPMERRRIEELIRSGKLRNSKHYTPEERAKLVSSYDPAKATPEKIAIAKEIGNKFDENLVKGQDWGVLGEGQENYVTHLWGKNKDNPVARSLIHEGRTGRFSTNTVMAKRRMLQSAFEGQLLGLKLNKTDPVALAAYNGAEFGRIAAARQFVDTLRSTNVRASDGRPMVVLAGTGKKVEGPNGEPIGIFANPNSQRSIKIADKVVAGLRQSGDLDKLLERGDIISKKDSKGNTIYSWDPSDYRTIDSKAMRDWLYLTSADDGTPVYMKGDIKVHPDAYKYLNRLLGAEKSFMREVPALHALQKGTREAKAILLFGDTFHYAQEGLRGIMTGVSPFGVDRWDLRTDPTLRKLVEGGLTLGTDYGSVQRFQEGLTSGPSVILSKIPGLRQWQNWLENYLFEKYIPSLKARASKKLFAEYREKYPEWTMDKVAETAAADTNERFGGINYERLGRSTATQDVFRLVALAPDWLESEVRFIARAFGEEGKVAQKDIAKVALGMWAATRVLNSLTTGELHNEAPFGVVLKDEDGTEKIWTMRTIPSDMIHAIHDPSGFISGRASPLYRTAAQTYMGRDEWGRKLPAHSLPGNLLMQTAPIFAQTAIKERLGVKPETSTPEQFSKAAGLSVYPYKTEAAQLAAELASDHSPDGPVDTSNMKLHILKMKWEDDIRGGRMKPEQLYEMVQKGEVAPADAKGVIQNIKDTRDMTPDEARFYLRASRLAAPEFLKVWDKAGADERALIARLLIKKRKAYFKKSMTGMTAQQRTVDPTLNRLMKLFPEEPPF